MRWLPIAALLCAPALAQSLAHRIESELQSSAAARRTVWGIEVFDLSNGEMLYEQNAGRFFTPASNAKLFTSALALMRLGPAYRFQTSVRSAAAPDAAGLIAGDLVLVGGGDPMLSARAVPYQRTPSPGNPLQAIEALADQVVSAGVRRIDGDIIGDDTAYVWEPYPEGWAVDDAVWDYGAPVSALTVNDNMLTLTLRASPPALILSPPLEYYAIDNRVQVGAGLETKIHADRLPGSRQLRLWGTLSSNARAETQLLLAIDDPAIYAAYALRDALTSRGVSVRGRPLARHRLANEKEPGPVPEGFQLAGRASPPLLELLRILDKVSQNLHAELMLREVGRICRRSGSRQAGLEELGIFLGEVGIADTDYTFADGSGLSRVDLVTPQAVLALLRFMYSSRYRDDWIALLPLGAADGTLATRFDGNPAARRIHAKTGSLDHVAALSGYAESPTRGTLAFSILANNSNVPAAEIRNVIDRLALLLAQ